MINRDTKGKIVLAVMVVVIAVVLKGRADALNKGAAQWDGVISAQANPAFRTIFAQFPTPTPVNVDEDEDTRVVALTDDESDNVTVPQPLLPPTEDTTHVSTTLTKILNARAECVVLSLNDPNITCDHYDVDIAHLEGILNNNE